MGSETLQERYPVKQPRLLVRYLRGLGLLEVRLFGRLRFYNIGRELYRAQRAWARVETAVLFLQVWPVYLQVGGRDCDGYSIARTYRLPTYYHLHQLARAIEDGADGWVTWHQISRAEYLEIQAQERED